MPWVQSVFKISLITLSKISQISFSGFRTEEYTLGNLNVLMISKANIGYFMAVRFIWYRIVFQSYFNNYHHFQIKKVFFFPFLFVFFSLSLSCSILVSLNFVFICIYPLTQLKVGKAMRNKFFPHFHWLIQILHKKKKQSKII